uniref:Capsid protein n=1 Tax=Rosellinia necatrix partitivirus 18 TaxID=2699386 RepID=A0A6F8QH96_9VIRU|nr:capsid protein [Rosellinia necatrix partitivirus 18]
MSSLANKLASLKNKSVVLEVQDIKYPDNIADPLALFEKNSSPKTASANDWTIDVFPSQIPIFMYIMQIAAAASAAADHKNQAKSSLATFVLYYAVVLQGFFLLNDLHVRPSPSAHASSWSTVSWKNKFAEYLLSLPVPDSMKTIFAQLSATETARTKNVFFVPSAAGFNIHHFFGRFVPINFFAHLHDCIATMPGNSKPSEIQQDFLSRQLFKLLANHIPNKTFATCADILGIHPDGTTNVNAVYATGKWYQVFSSVFNPVLFRDFHRRSSLATLDLQTPNFKKASAINAYDILFAATPYNLNELRTVLDHLAPIIKSVTPMTKSLSQVISEATGINILQHGYSTFALPTWLSNPDTTNKTFISGTGKLKSQDYDARAADLTFLVATPDRPAKSDVKVADLSSGATITALHFPWSLVSTGHTAASKPTDADFVVFDDNVHPTPRVLVLDVLASETVSAHLATLCGMIIESFELDATTVEHPNVDKSLASQNSLFADSAIPYKYVVRATRFYKRTDQLPPVCRRLLPKPSTSQPAASLLHDRTKVMLPLVDAKDGGPVGTAAIHDAGTFTTLPGMTKTSNFNWIKYAQSFLGFRTLNPNSSDDDDKIPQTDLDRLYLWSPYTYTPVYDSDCTELVPDLTANRSYFLSNLRSIFGTDVNLVEVEHPFVAMPV